MTSTTITQLLDEKSEPVFNEADLDVIASAGLDDAEWRDVWIPLINAQKYKLALNLFKALPPSVTKNPDLQYNWDYTLKALGLLDQSLEKLKALVKEYPDVSGYKSLQSHVLLQMSRPGEAISLLEQLHEDEPENWHHLLALANVYNGMGSPSTALRYLKAFIGKGFGNETVLVHAALAARAAGRNGEAEGLLLQAIEDAPTNPQAYQMIADLYCNMNRLADALEAIDHALVLSPDDVNYRNLRIAIVERRAGAVRPPYQAGAKLRPLPKSLRRRNPDGSSVLADIATYLSVIWNIALRDIRTRESKSKIGIAMTVVEPLAHIGALWVVMSFTLHGRPPLGEHWFFFYATGVLPFLMLTHLGGHGVHGHEPHRHLLEVPIITPSAILLGAAIAELIIASTVAILLFGAFYFAGIFHGTNNFYGVVGAYLSLWLLGVGIMFMNTGMSTYFSVWGKAWYSTQRILYFTSGIFYMAQNTPVAIREILTWNPLLVGIEWFRNGFFEGYEPPWLDKGYLLLVAGMVLVFGVAIERLSNRVADH